MTTADLPFDLIDAKLATPTLPMESVARTELVDRLRSSPAPVASVVAPAGSGKTTLIAQWAEQDPRPFASISLDERDNDPVLLLRYVAAALRRVEPIAPSVFEALSGPGKSIWSTCVPRVAGALSSMSEPTVFVLDDLHFVSSPTCLDVVAMLLEHVPPGSQLVAVTREDPQLPLARLRAQRRLLEIGLDDLSRMTDERITFLTRTSVLDQMCPGLCDALLDRTDSAAVLKGLERSNRFLIPLDRRRQWYRYHHLFRDLLRHELAHREPGQVPELCRRAMDWCATNGLPATAIRYGHDAGEVDAVAALIEENAMAAYWEGQSATLDEWLEWYDGDEILERHPVLAVYGAVAHALSGRAAAAARWLHAAERGHPEDAPLPDGTASFEPWVAVARAVVAPAGVTRMLADAELAAAQLHPQSQWRPTALLSLGVARALEGSVDTAHAALADAAEAAAAVGDADTGFVALGERAVLSMGQGAWEDAASHARRAHQVVEQTGLGDYVTSAIVAAVGARIAVHEGRADEARAHAAQVHRLRPLLTTALPWYSAQVILELARVHLALREPGVAGTLLAEVDEILRQRPGLGALAAHARELRERVDASTTPSWKWALSLTAAELRLLPLLATHLLFPQLGERLFLSKTTVKTQAISIYCKFGVSSRADAIDRALQLGLMDDSLQPNHPGFLQSG